MIGEDLSMSSGPSVARPVLDAGGWPIASRMRIGFVMEQVLGHVTWYRNLRGAVTDLGSIDARWVETRLFDPNGVIEKIPGIPPYARAGVRGLLDVRRGLRGWPCDVLVFNTQKPAIFCQWQTSRTPTMLLTDVTPIQYDRMACLYDHQVDENPVVRIAKHQANVLNFRLAAALVPCSTWAADSMIRDYGMPPEKVHVIPIGLDTKRWCPRAPRQMPDRVRLLFVGGHFERKGGRLLLEVFHSLGLHDRAELHVVTRDAVEPVPGLVVHRGLENDSAELLQLYQSADAFVLPTLADCFSNASLEAMAVGLPVITTAVGGIPDIVEHRKTGYLLAAGHRRDLAAALLRVVDNAPLRAMMGAAGRQRAVRRFDARTQAAKILQLAHVLVEKPYASPLIDRGLWSSRSPSSRAHSTEV
ncbi:MAG: glycosyltransferase family 4 protein [bacterium]